MGRGGGGGGEIGFDPLTVTGIDASQPGLGLVKSDQVTDGRFLRTSDDKAALVTSSYAEENGLSVGDDVEVGSKDFEVAGIVSAPLGGEASDVYVPLETLQRISDREGRVNQLQVEASEVEQVDAVAAAIGESFQGAEVTTAQELNERVSGSLISAQDLSDKLGAALGVVALVSAFGLTALLTLSSVNKRTRELGTLKAIGWPRSLVVRQISGESLAQGLLGGAAGVLIGLGGSALVGALDITLKATAGAEQAAGGFPGGGGGPGAEVVSQTSTVVLGAPVDGSLIAIAVGLAVVGGLIAGSIGAVRAARLSPAVALRSVE